MRGAEVFWVGLAEEDGWLVCLFEDAEAALALEREAPCWRKAAKNVERKKGRCDGMLRVIWVGDVVDKRDGVGLWRLEFLQLCVRRQSSGLGERWQVPACGVDQCKPVVQTGSVL